MSGRVCRRFSGQGHAVDVRAVIGGRSVTMVPTVGVVPRPSSILVSVLALVAIDVVMEMGVAGALMMNRSVTRLPNHDLGRGRGHGRQQQCSQQAPSGYPHVTIHETGM